MMGCHLSTSFVCFSMVPAVWDTRWVSDFGTRRGTVGSSLVRNAKAAANAGWHGTRIIYKTSAFARPR